MRPYFKVTADEVRAAYRSGVRDFSRVDLSGVDLSGANLSRARFDLATFYGAKLMRANFSLCSMEDTQLKGADLSGADLSNADISRGDLIAGNFTNANMRGCHLMSVAFFRSNLAGADLSGAYLATAHFSEAILSGARFDRAVLSHTNLASTDVGAFCGASLIHQDVSYLDWATIAKSYRHPGLKPFMMDCGVPALFAEYMIDCARAVGEGTLRGLMQSTFISYGGPDERFARRLYGALKAAGVVTFFFPVSATVGRRIGDEVFTRVNEYDRILLVCSRKSLNREGVVNEIQETLDREAKGGTKENALLLPIMLDDYVLKGWKTKEPVLAERIGRRVIADFRGAQESRPKFRAALERVLDALKVKPPVR